MKNIDQIKSLIIGCYINNIYEISITVYNEYRGGVEIISWDRIDIKNDTIISLNTVYIYPNNHISFNLSSTDTASITVYGSSIGKKILTSFKNKSSRLSIINVVI